MPGPPPPNSPPPFRPPFFTVGTYMLLLAGALVVYSWMQSVRQIGARFPRLGEVIAIGCAALLVIGTVGPIIALVRRERGRFWMLPVLILSVLTWLFVASWLLR